MRVDLLVFLVIVTLTVLLSVVIGVQPAFIAGKILYSIESGFWLVGLFLLLLLLLLPFITVYKLIDKE